MRQPGEVLLISCYELGHQPIGLASPLGFLERAGYLPAAIDLSVQKLDADKVAQARFIGISVPMHTALRIGVRVAERVREINPAGHIAFFGLYASLNADYLLERPADSVIGGEFESALVSLVETLAAGLDRPIEGVQRKGKPASPLLTHIPFVQAGRRALPPLEKYARLEENGVRRIVGYVEASRGCRHLCRHCPIPPVYDGRFFLVPQEIVLEDIRNLVRLGAAHITFGDPDFLNGPNHSLRMVRAMRREFPNVTFDFTAKIEHILQHQALIPEFGALGCRFIVSAVESLNDTVLQLLDKNHTRADVTEALKIVRKAGVTLRPSLVAFTPWSGLDDILNLFDFVEKEELIDSIDPVQYTIRLLIPPGSLLLNEPSVSPYLGSLIQESFSYHWTHPDPRMDRLQALFRKAVERAAQEDEDPEITFYQLRELALAMKEERTPNKIQHRPRADRPRPPRLTEPWFCCAEPTDEQFGVLEESEKII
ncbi:MAG TPA: CUAEP/CCAEP-tail radical SAM protein [Candidatus Manganitrophaceae bacterium]|nr:CUAEP/CCAEP-tail radical SAM protein [Candidatus Manganitrophaceae bacterium]